MIERLELARSSLSIARFAAAAHSNRSIAKREIPRARAEVAAVSRMLDAARIHSILSDRKPAPEIAIVSELTRSLLDALGSTSRSLSHSGTIKLKTIRPEVTHPKTSRSRVPTSKN